MGYIFTTETRLSNKDASGIIEYAKQYAPDFGLIERYVWHYITSHQGIPDKAKLNTDIQNDSNNHTRFICVSKKPEIYPGADHTSLMLVLPNRPGELYRLLGRFNAQGINLTKLESRPMPGKDFEFMFCFDIDASVYSPAFARLIEELDVTLEQFSYLGSYSELA